jgi:hypothetical protein
MDESMICKAAIMAGAIDNKKGGIVSFLITPPVQSVSIIFFIESGLVVDIIWLFVLSVSGLCEKRGLFAVGMAGALRIC